VGPMIVWSARRLLAGAARDRSIHARDRSIQWIRDPSSAATGGQTGRAWPGNRAAQKSGGCSSFVHNNPIAVGEWRHLHRSVSTRVSLSLFSTHSLCLSSLGICWRNICRVSRARGIYNSSFSSSSSSSASASSSAGLSASSLAAFSASLAAPQVSSA
jgi:hypothetical protein